MYPHGQATAKSGPQENTMEQPTSPEVITSHLSDVTGFTTPQDLTFNEYMQDEAEVQKCLNKTIDYYHGNLTESILSEIEKKWGITPETATAKKIGYSGESGDHLYEHLSQQFSDITILRTGILSCRTLSHLTKCSGISPDNTHLIPDSLELPPNKKHTVDDPTDTDILIDEDCRHTVPEYLDKLKLGLVYKAIDPNQINYEALIHQLNQDVSLSFYQWWDNRITFPYKNEDGEYCYIIGRATANTEDKIYNNGITDITTRNLAQIQHQNQYLDDPEPLVPNTITLETPDSITKDVESPYDEDWIPKLTYDVTIDPTNEQTHTPVVNTDPAAIAVDIGTEITFNIETPKDTSTTPEITIIDTPDGNYWADKSGNTATFTCEERGYYLYIINYGEYSSRGLIYARDYFNKDRRSGRVEGWLDPNPNYALDKPKYLKQSFDPPYLQNNVIDETLYGCETVHESKTLVQTEGITDAIMAHQHDIPCISPAAANVKGQHYDTICEYAEKVSSYFIVNDTEENNTGINGAIKTAMILKQNGHQPYISELPLDAHPHDVNEIDLADFFNHNTKEDFLEILQEYSDPENHPEYDPDRHNPTTGDNTQNRSSNTNSNTSRNNSTGTSDWDNSGDSSVLFDMTLRDVIPHEYLTMENRANNTVYRGVNPIADHKGGNGYFLIRDHGDFVTAKDFTIESGQNAYYYKPLTWIACEATCTCKTDCDCSIRTVRRPMGDFNHEELWWCWHHVKTTDRFDIPDEDPVPLRGIWHIASHHNLLPDEFIPDDYDDELTLPDTIYNNALDIIKTEYGLNPGREYRNTNDDDNNDTNKTNDTNNDDNNDTKTTDSTTPTSNTKEEPNDIANSTTSKNKKNKKTVDDNTTTQQNTTSAPETGLGKEHTDNPIEYTLNTTDLKLAKQLGNKRNSKGFDGTVDIDSTDAHIIGLKGEVAFANIYEIDPDFTYNDSGGDDGSDFTTTIDGEEKQINVKISTYYDDPWLKVRSSRIDQDSDIYVLGAINDSGNKIKFVGWATHEMVANKEPTMKTGSKNHVLPPDELNPIFEPANTANNNISITDPSSPDEDIPGVKVKLSNIECDYAERIAKDRATNFEHDDYESTTYNGDSHAVHLRGAKSEVAVAKYYNLGLDETIRPKGDTTDFAIRCNGKDASLDVKSTTYLPPWLWVREHKTNSDYYIATYLENEHADEVWIVGWATQHMVLEGDYIESPVDNESHMNYRLKEDALDPLPSKELIKEPLPQ